MKLTKPVIVKEQSCVLEDWQKEGRSGVTWRTLLSSDRTDSDSITMGIAYIEPGNPEDLHLHQHEPAEAYYVLSGCGYVSIDGIISKLEKGMAVFAPSNAVHAVGNDSAEMLQILYVFGVDSFEDVKYVFPE